MVLLLAISSQKVYLWFKPSRQRYREPVISGVLSPYTGIHPHGVGRLIIWVSINLHDNAMKRQVCNIRAEKMPNVSSKDLLVKLGINDLPTILKESFRLRWWVIIHMLWEVSLYGYSSTCYGKSLYMGIHPGVVGNLSYMCVRPYVVGNLFIWVFIHLWRKSFYMGIHPHDVGSLFTGYSSTSCCLKSLFMGIHLLVVRSFFIWVFIHIL